MSYSQMGGGFLPRWIISWATVGWTADWGQLGAGCEENAESDTWIAAAVIAPGEGGTAVASLADAGLQNNSAWCQTPTTHP